MVTPLVLGEATPPVEPDPPVPPAGGGVVPPPGGGGGVEPSAAGTVMVPFMSGWRSQWYGYVPGPAKVKLHDWPLLNTPLSKAPVSDVTVWLVSWLFHVTTPPACTENALGE